jgi:TRAP transporter TAXI family solute receptor
MRATMEELIRIKGWTQDSFKPTAEIKTQDQAQALCTGKVDAIIYALGHPNAAVQQITSMCDTRIIGISGDAVDKFITKYPFYAYTTIPGGLYMHNKDMVKTFGVKALLVTTEALDDKVAYEFVKSVFENIDNFKTLHPVFAALDPRMMIEDARGIAPLHAGAEQYYKEHGLLKP